MAFITVSSGVTSSVTVSAGDTLKVLSGGISSQSTVLAGAREVVLANGLSLDDAVESGGALTVSDGGEVSSATVSSGGLITLDDGSLPNGVVVSSGGTAAFVDGLVIAGDDITLGGPQTQNGTVDSGAVTVMSGGYVTMQTVDVESGGTATVASNALVSGQVFVDAGGVLQGIGELGSSATVAFDYVFDDGTVNDVQIGDFSGNAADLVVLSGGETSGTLLANGYVQLFAHATGVAISAVNGEVLLSAGAETIGDLIVGDGDEFVNAAAKSLSATVAEGGVLEIVSGGIGKFETIAAGGIELDYAAPVADAALVLSGGVFAFGNGTISSGQRLASEEATSTVTVRGVTLASGGIIGYVTTTIDSGGTLILRAGGVAADVALEGGDVLGPGDLTGVNEGGYVSGADIAGGVFSDDAGEVANVTVGVEGTGSMYVAALASGVIVVDGVVNVYGGGLAQNVTVADDVSQLTLYSGGTASGINLDSGGELALSGGRAFNVLVYAGGVISAASGTSGELEGRILDAGAVSGAEVAFGALLQVDSGGRAIGVTLDYGAQVRIEAGGVARDLDTISGAQIIDAGVLAFTGANALGGGLSGAGRLVQSGGGILDITGDASAFVGDIVISDGTVKLATRLGPDRSDVRFAAGAGDKARLHLDGLSQPASGARLGETLTNFDSLSDQVDLIGQAFAAGAKASLVGHTLTLTDGAYTAKFTLSGTLAAHYEVISDGAGGTLVTAAATMAQALAAWRGAGGAALTPSSSAVTSRFSALAPTHG